jgi:zinc transport system permease protein
MACLASLLGCIAVISGIFLSTQWDWPAGPAIVVVATGIFILLSVIAAKNKLT